MGPSHYQYPFVSKGRGRRRKRCVAGFNNVPKECYAQSTRGPMVAVEGGVIVLISTVILVTLLFLMTSSSGLEFCRTSRRW